MTYLRQRLITCCLLGLLAGPANSQTATPDFTPGQAVEVREGDSWSAATFEKKEGRKFQIKYTDGGTEEWVNGDRIRVPGSAPKEGAPATTKPAAKARATFDINQHLEAKWGGSWRAVVVNNTRAGGWYLVTYTPGSSQEWVEWWRLRRLGSTSDIPTASPNGFYRKGGDTPRADAGDGPGDKNGDKKPGEAKKDGDKEDFAHPITDRDTAAMKEVLPAFTGAWNVTPDPADLKLVSAGEPIGITGEKDVFVKRTVFHSGTMAGVLFRDDRGGQTKSCRFQRVNLAAGSASSMVEF